MLKRLRAFLFLTAVAVSLSLGGSPPAVAEADVAQNCTKWVWSCTSYSYACYTGSDGRTYWCNGQSCGWTTVKTQCCGYSITVGGGLTGF